MSFIPKNYAPDVIRSAASEYANGLAMHVVASKYRIASKTLRRLFLELGMKLRDLKSSINASEAHNHANMSRRKLSDAERSAFRERYLAGDISVADLANQFGISKGIARKILKNDMIFRSPAYLSYVVNEKYFESIDTPDKSYWFGFIMADGCVFGGASPGLRIGLKIDDFNHLVSFRDCIDSNHPVKTSDKKFQWKGVVRTSGSCCIDIRNKKMVADLMSHGCIPNKTKMPTEISGVPDHLFSHFLRGYFDGDGCISFHERHGKLRKDGSKIIECTWSCVGSISMIRYLHAGLIKLAGIELSCPKIRKGCWIIYTSCSGTVESLHSFMYSGTGPFLPRKYEKWKEGAHALKSQY